MTGYFSSLIQQTGITFGPHSNNNSEVLESPTISLDGPDRTTPIHVMEEKVVESPTDEGFKQPDLHNENNNINYIEEKILIAISSEGSDRTTPIHVMEEKVVESPTDEGFKQPDLHNENNNINYIEEKILINPQTGKSAVETHEDIKTGSMHSELYAGSNSNQYLKEDIRKDDSEESKIEGEKPKRRLVTKYNSLRGTRKDKNPPIPDLEKGGEGGFEKGFSGEDTTKPVSQEQIKNIPEEGTISSNQLTREQIWKATFKEVREWVAETPTPSLPDQRLLSKISETGYAEKEKEKPEIHDFNLSIGSISLTIEEPRKEIQNNKPVQIRRDERPTNESSFSRLSRHYIRI